MSNAEVNRRRADDNQPELVTPNMRTVGATEFCLGKEAGDSNESIAAAMFYAMRSQQISDTHRRKVSP